MKTNTLNILSWNCLKGGLFHNGKLQTALAASEFDIAVISEVASPLIDSALKLESHRDLLSQFNWAWVGPENRAKKAGDNRGLIVLAKKCRFELSRMELPAFGLEWFLPVQIEDKATKSSFNLLGAWTHPKKDGYWKTFFNYFSKNRAAFLGKPLIIAGDLNDDPVAPYVKKDIERLANDFGIRSVYHRLKVGDKRDERTFFSYNRDGSFRNVNTIHTEYIFASETMDSLFVPRKCRVLDRWDNVDAKGEPHRSDHAAMLAQFECRDTQDAVALAN